MAEATTTIQIENVKIEKLENGIEKCGEVFMERNNDRIIYFCTLCDRKFYLIDLFLEHIKVEYLQQEDQSSDFDIEAEESADQKPSPELIDDFLKKEFDEMSAMESVDPIEYAEQDWNDNENSRDSTSKITADFADLSDEDILKSKLTCKHCNENFDLVRDLQQHDCGFGVLDKKVFKCDICQKIFARKKNLSIHMVTHESFKPHACDICGASFAHKQNLIVHVRRHTSEKPFKCDYCDKAFVSSTEKISHTRSHTGERKFVCEICGSGHASSSKLNDHRMRHLNIRNHECPHCDKKFCKAYTLKMHRMTHEDVPRSHKCDMCDAAFKTKKTLTQHIKIHAKVKNYSCKICFKTFAQHPGLYSHMKMHAISK